METLHTSGVPVMTYDIGELVAIVGHVIKSRIAIKNGTAVEYVSAVWGHMSQFPRLQVVQIQIGIGAAVDLKKENVFLILRNAADRISCRVLEEENSFIAL